MQDIINTHAVAESSRLKATYGGAHIFSVQMLKDMDNGSLVALGDYVEGDVYKGDDLATGKAAVLVLNPPLCENTLLKEYTEERHYYNAKDAVVRGYELAVRDVFTVSADKFASTPTVGKFVTWTAASQKYTPAASAPTASTGATTGFYARVIEKVAYTKYDAYRLEVLAIL